jgi:hypothetical protein
MDNKIDISSLDAQTKTKLDYYVVMSKELQQGIPVEITLKFAQKIKFYWSEGMTGFVSPHSDNESYCKYSLDWHDLGRQEQAIEDKYNTLIKEICEFSDKVADSLNVDRNTFFTSFFL